MPFPRPTLQVLIDRVSAAVALALGLGALVRRSVLDALARALAGASHQIHGLLEWLADQLFPDTATAAHLERWASVWQVTRQPAEAASGSIEVDGTESTLVPAGTRWQRAGGEEYVSSEDVELGPEPTPVPVEAVEAGLAGNAAESTTLSLVVSLAGVASSATVLEPGLEGGLDQEDDDALRARVLARIQEPPMGGAAHDYTAWALEIAAVTRAWVFPLWQGPGTVRVIFVTDGTEDGPLPSGAKIAEVEEHIQEQRPVTAEVAVGAPVLAPLDLTISVTPDTPAVRAAVTSSLEELLRREAEPGGTILLSHIKEAISLAPGETDHVLHAPAANVEHEETELAVLGEITWEP